jgi:hypothetical protein
MIRIVLGFAVVIATASATTAQNSKASSANELAALSGRPASDYTAAFRAKLTQTFAAYCQELLNAKDYRLHEDQPGGQLKGVQPTYLERDVF